jgi:uncharacterized OB-fold protein
MTPAPRRGPTPDQDSAPFWSALDEHRIVMQHCGSCGTYRCPPLPACHVCGATEFTWEDADDAGVVYSWIGVRHPVGGLSADELPVVFATVEFAHGARLVTRYLGGERATIGEPVLADFVAHDTWTELVVRPVGGTA